MRCRDLQEVGRSLVANDVTFFFDIDSNGTSARWLQSIFFFQQERNPSNGKYPYGDKMVRSMPTLQRDSFSPALTS